MTGSSPRWTVFLDRDGVINLEKDYLYRVEDFVFVPGAPQAIARLNQAGAKVVVVTNQSGVARGYYGMADVQRLHSHLQSELARSGAHIDAFYVCPDHPEATVAEYRRDTPDRKPGAGMFWQAIRELGLAQDQRFVVGDSLRDLEAGEKVGCRKVLVMTGYGEQSLAEAQATGFQIDHIAADLPAAVDWLLGVLVLRGRTG